MMSSKELVNDFHFRIVDSEMCVMVIMIFAIKNISEQSGSRESGVTACAVQAVQSKMHQVDVPVSRKRQKRQAKRWKLHDGIFNKAVIPCGTGDKIRWFSVVPSVESVKCREMKNVMNDEGPDLADHVPRKQFHGRILPPIIGVQNCIGIVPDACGHTRHKETNEVYTEASPADPVIAQPIRRFERSVFAQRILVPLATDVQVHEHNNSQPVKHKEYHCGLQTMLQRLRNVGSEKSHHCHG